MALLFSAVTLTDDDDQMELLVPGIPRESNDLRGWTAYENFIASIDHEQEIRVHVAACLYGEGQPFLASPEEIAYFTLREKEEDSFRRLTDAELAEEQDDDISEEETGPVMGM